MYLKIPKWRIRASSCENNYFEVRYRFQVPPFRLSLGMCPKTNTPDVSIFHFSDINLETRLFRLLVKSSVNSWLICSQKKTDSFLSFIFRKVLHIRACANFSKGPREPHPDLVLPSLLGRPNRNLPRASGHPREVPCLLTLYTHPLLVACHREVQNARHTSYSLEEAWRSCDTTYRRLKGNSRTSISVLE